MGSCKIHNIRFYNLEPRAINCMSYDGTVRKLALSRSDSCIEVWDIAYTPHVESTILSHVNDSVEALAWSNGRLFSTGLQGVVIEYDLQALTAKYNVPVTSGPAWCMDINKPKTTLAVGTEDGHINIFEITDTHLTFEKVLDRQDGRILCLCWDSTGSFIVSGSVDVIRIWDVKSGHAVHRMLTGRAEVHKETIVWCVAVTADFTIVTGDSRGRICFWNGHTGTQLESFLSHKADILCLCLDEENNCVYSSGVDPVITNFTRIRLKCGDYQGVKNKWVRSIQRRIHTHDVRALVLADNKLYSAGVDSYLAMSSFPPKALHKYAPTLQPPSVQLCRQAHCILLRYSRHLEVWKLGTFKEPLTREGHIPLSSDPIQLVRLEAKEGGLIASAALSDDANWLVYSTNSQVYCHRLFLEDGVPRLQKVDMSAEHSDVAQRIVFTLDGTQVILATTSGSIKILNLLEDHIERVISFNPHVDKLLKGPVKLLAVSGDGHYLVAGDKHANIVVWNLASLQYHLSLPKHRCSPTALGIQSSTNNLVVVYADHKVVEVNLKTGKFSNFSKLLSGHMPTQWSSRCFPVNNVTFDPRNDNIIILHDDTTICVIDKDKDLPLAEAKIPRLESSGMSDGVDSSNQGYPRTSSPQHAFHFIKKYKHLVHLEWLVGEELVAVEVSPASLAEKLPPSLKQKKYGM